MADIAIFRINYKSDFILTLNSDAGWLTPFCIKFWTGAPSKAYYAYYDGMNYTHCAPVEGEPTKLMVQFDDHHLPVGDLKFQIGYHFTVADFPTSVEDEFINQASVIIEVDDAPAQVMLDFTGETAPEIQFLLPAYANEAQRIANEQARIAAEEQRIANEQARISAEETRQANEQQRINQEAARVSEFARLKTESEAATYAAATAAGAADASARNANDKAALAQAAAALANAKAQLAADKAAVAQSAANLANTKAQLAEEKADLAQQKADYAQTQGNYAKEQGDAAKTEAENAHALNEEVRDDEEARDQAEQIRQQQEAARQQAEAARETAYEQAEAGRNTSFQQAEADRTTAFSNQLQQQQTAYTEAEAARETAFNEAETERDAKVDEKVADITNLQAQVGYFVCDTAAATAAKTIAATGYSLTTGGNIRIKMTNANTADAVTLNINNTGAKALFYNGTQASSTNSWEAGEVIEVYYDGTNYQASNTQGGGGSGEGAFDISKYKTVGGIVPIYKTLAEALGTNGANVPESKRKGGMSVKYIQLTEATYNITKTEGIETQPTGTEIQEAISIADGDYSKSDLSSIETLPTTLGSKVVYYLAVRTGEEPETVTTYTTWVIIKLSNESTKYVQWMLKSTAWSIVPSNWAGEEDVPKKDSLSTVTSGGFYNLYAPIITVFERNVTGWVNNIPIILYPGIKYTITVTKASSSLTVLSVQDCNGTGTNIIDNVRFANRTIEYTPENYIVSISLYSESVANFRIQCDNAKKTLLTHSDVVNNMLGGSNVPLSAEMGKELNNKTFFLNYYYYPVSSGLFSEGDSSHAYNITYCEAVLKNQDIASLSVKDGYEYIIYGKSDNIRSSERLTNITSSYIRDKWVNTSSVGYLWVLIRKTDSSVIDCNELSSILVVEYNGAKTQFNKIYTQDDVYRLGRREDLTVNYVNGDISIDYGTRTESESSTNFISEYIDVSKIAALSFVVSSKYSSSQFSPSLPVLWYDSNKNYIGHTSIQILTKNRKAIIGVPDAASYAVFSGKYTVEAIYRQDAIDAHYSIGYKSVLGKLKKVSLVICHGQSLMLGADTTSSTVFPKRKRYSSLLVFSFYIGTEPQTQDNNYAGFATLDTLYDKESPRLGLGEMFIQTVAKENNISVEANEWENHLMLMPSAARGDTSIETLSSDEEYANVEAFIRNAKRFCDEYGYELDAPAWVWFQGEANLGSQTPKDTYKSALLALHERICGSLSTIAGITTRPKCIIYQPSSQCIQSTQAADYGYSNGKLGVPTAFAELLAENDEFLAAAPTYILTPATSGGIYIHCDAESYNLLGAYAGYALKKYLIDGISMKGVIPLSYTVSGNTVKIKYNVPSPPLCVDTNWVREVAHYGYTCVKSDGTDIVTDVSVYWDTVTITCNESPIGCKLRYGLNGDRVEQPDGYWGCSGRIYGGRGNIRDNQGNAICKEMPNGKIYPMHNWAYCFEKLLE